MRFGSWDIVCWISGVFGLALLVGVLIIKKRYRSFPWFTSLLVYEVVQTVVLYMTHRYSPNGLYALAYWVGEFLESLVRVGVIFELARLSAFHLGRDQRESTKPIFITFLVATAVCILAVVLHGSLANPIASLAITVSLCSAILGGFLAIMLFTTVWFEGIRFQVHSQAIAFGMVVYFSGKLVAEGALLLDEQGFWIQSQNYLKPLYILCLFTWSLIFWFDEPEQILNEEMARLQRVRTKLENLTGHAKEKPVRRILSR